MAWSGGTFRKGNYSTNGWTGDASLGIGIEAGRHDTQDDDFANGINQCLNKDGTNAATGNLNIGSNKITNLANGTVVADAINLGQAQAGIDTQGTALSTTQTRFSADAVGPYITLRKSRGATVGTNTIAQNSDQTGALIFAGANGTGYDPTSAIIGSVDGVPGASSDMPGALRFYTTPDGSATLAERMIINKDGDVALGGTTPAGGGVRLYVKKDVSGYGGILVDNQDQRLSVTSNFVSGVNQFGSIQAVVASTNTPNKLALNPLGGNVLINKQSDVITGSGSFFTQAAANYPALLINTKDFSGTVNVLQNHHAGTYVGGVNYSNTATSFPTSSDYRLKENVVPLTDAVTRIEQLSPCRFNFIVEPEETIDGFLAHEVAAVVPNAVDGEKDAVNADGSIKIQSLDHSKLVPLLVAAVKELAARVAALEA
jgi:hypothetical protein